MKGSQPTEFNYGGQAVIEGVMMRGAKTLAVAVRNPSGEIVVHTETLDSRIYGGRVARIPVLRGMTLLWDALGLGIKSLMFSADIALEEEPDEQSEEQLSEAGSETPTLAPVAEEGKPLIVEFKDSDEEKKSLFDGPVGWGTILLSLSMSVVIFFLLPAFLAGLFERYLGVSHQVSNIIEGIARLTLLIGYVSVISLMSDVKRLYGYHGAEHKTINAYEAGAELSPGSVSAFSIEHPRCGTAFLLTVVVISILLFSLFPPLGLGLRLLSRILLLPLIAGIAYEFLRYSARNQDKWFIRQITKPNLALQHLTTREPDESMLEVAIVALERVLASDQGRVPLFEPEAAIVPLPTD